MFCWETLSAGVHVNATWHALMAMAPQQDNVPWYMTNTAKEQLEEHNKGALGIDRASKFSQIPIWLSICRSKSDPWRPHLTAQRTQRICFQYAGARYQRTPTALTNLSQSWSTMRPQWIGLVLPVPLTLFQPRQYSAGSEQCLFSNQFFTLRQPQKCLATRKSGSKVSSTLCSHVGKHNQEQHLHDKYLVVSGDHRLD